MGKTINVTLGADIPLVINLVKYNDGEPPIALTASEVTDLQLAMISFKGEREPLEWKDYGDDRIIAVYHTHATGSYALEVTGKHDGLRIASREPVVVRVTFYNQHDGTAASDDGYHVETEVAIYDDPDTGADEKIATALAGFFIEKTEAEMDEMLEQGTWEADQFYYTLEEDV